MHRPTSRMSRPGGPSCRALLAAARRLPLRVGATSPAGNGQKNRAKGRSGIPRTRHRLGRASVVVLTLTAGIMLSRVATATAAVAAPPEDLNTVINNIRQWLVGLLIALATLFLTIGGIRRMLAGGDPGEVAKSKDALKAAALGYGIAALAPLLVEILKGFVGAG
jgi:type IV secretion system pilin